MQLANGEDPVGASIEIGGQLGFWTLAPFACMLLAMAVMPLTHGHWFEINRNKGIVAFVLGAPTVVYVIARFGRTGLDLAAGTAHEYISFIVLLAALFAISGGIYLTGNLVATPRHNLAFLGVGAVLASFIGTMGASMVLIRPLLRANSERKYAKHTVVFFIFAVSNVGGLLTPLGDPPLFLGFLRGVPFTWTFRLWAEWLLSVGLVLLVYLALDLHYHRKEPAAALAADEADYVPMRIKGWFNAIPLVLVIVAVLFSDALSDAGAAIHFPFVREVILVVITIVSLTVGPRGPRASNHFHWGPMVEVGVLFAGIFATMIPALALLQARGASIGLAQPWHYFWVTGGLSSFLDNAPTYLAFTSVAQGQVGADSVGALTASGVIPGLGFSPAAFLAAISCGAVMMGAMTYIGNAPNFAVKCIAEKSGLKMPSFFGYMKYSLAFLVPIFVIVTVIFFL
jgi:Na+/H+ antiporter NhaD/arsenite permease-like protein